MTTRSIVEDSLAILRAIAGSAHLEGVHLHRFRHTITVICLCNEGELFPLQVLLGRSEIEILFTYAQDMP